MRPPPRQIDLARYEPAIPSPERPAEKHVVLPPITSDQSVRAIARVLQVTARTKRARMAFKVELSAITQLLKPWGIGADAIRLALKLTHSEGGHRYGTAHVPNAILSDYGAKTERTVKDVRDSEVYFRAAYLANAAKRLQTTMDEGGDSEQALSQERVYYRAHETARQGRLRAAAQVQTAADIFGVPDGRGTLVGWYMNPLLKNEVECIQANGHNFYAEEGTVIGLPGSVHSHCGCYASTPHEGAAMVNDVLGNVVKLQRSHPAFKLKARRTA